MGKSTHYQAPHYEIYKSHATLNNLGPKILLSSLFSHAYQMYVFLYMSDQVSNPRKHKK